MSVSIARYLKDFGEPQGTALAVAQDSEEVFALDDAAFAEVPAVDPEEIRRIAWAEGYEAAMQEATAKAEAERKELVAAHLEEMTAIEARQAEQNAGRIQAGLRNIADSLASAISEQVAAVLAPVMTEELTRNAVAELARTIVELLPDDEVVSIVVHGPKALFEILEAEPEMPVDMRFVENNDIDLVVEVDDRVLVTRLSAWAASLEKVME